MPIIEVHLMAGRTQQQKRRLMAEITDAAVRALDCSATTVRILITEHGPEEFSVGGVSVGERNQKIINGTHDVPLDFKDNLNASDTK